MKYLAVLAAALVLVAVLVLRPFAPSGEPVSVLFVGNSYTTSNDLARMFADLAAAGGYDATVEVVAWGGAWLRDHVGRGDARQALVRGDFDYVVLQEQSVVPASIDERLNAMYPAVRELVGDARNAGVEPVLFLTWARRDGFPDVGYYAYGPMQQAVTSAYEDIADEVDARVAPVGEAWSLARSFALHQSDGSHPTPAGSYLAAAVIYAAVFAEDPSDLRFDAGLDTAESLRSVAGRVVLADRARWRIPESSQSK